MAKSEIEQWGAHHQIITNVNYAPPKRCNSSLCIITASTRRQFDLLASTRNPSVGNLVREGAIRPRFLCLSVCHL